MTPGRLSAAILVVAILVCHGLFGAAHQTFMPSTVTHGHHMQAQAYDHGKNHEGHLTGHQTGHHEAGHLAGGAEYGAVLITVLLGTALGLLLRAIHLRDATTSFHPADRRFRVEPTGLHFPRGPALPALQVFRL